jgi:hypothetical protein
MISTGFAVLVKLSIYLIGEKCTAALRQKEAKKTSKGTGRTLKKQQ